MLNPVPVGRRPNLKTCDRADEFHDPRTIG
jgi:hypothetical protein